MKMCLGTVQFGMNYGIRRQKQPSFQDVAAMLDYVTQNGIDTIDTAYIYGNAEEVIGFFLKQKTIARDKLSIISKLQPNILDDKPMEKWSFIMRENLTESLSRLKLDYIDGYLMHSSRYVFNPYIVECLSKLKKEGLVKNIGVSVYEQAEAEAAVNSDVIDMLQIPYSIFDQRLEKGGFFNSVKLDEKIIFARSPFLQGLMLMNEEEIPVNLKKAIPIIREINEVSKKYGLSRVSLAIHYVKLQSKIDFLVFGVDNMVQLQENIREFAFDPDKDLIMEISKKFKNLEADLVIPSLWHKD